MYTGKFTWLVRVFIVALILWNSTAYSQTISGHKVVCLGASRTTLSISTSGGSWSSGNVTKATIDASTGEVTGVAAGTATISYTILPSTVFTTVVTVNAVTMSAIGVSAGSATMCAGGIPATCTVTPLSGNAWSSSDTSVASVSSFGVVAPSSSAAGTAIITYHHAAGNCKVTTNVTVNTGIAAITGTPFVCLGTTTALSHAVGGGTWSSAVPFTATVDVSAGIVTGVHTGITSITYTPASGCARTINVQVMNISMNITGTQMVCPEGTSTLTCSSSGGVWTSGDPSVSTINSSTGVFTGVNSGTAIITYTLGECYTTRVVTVSAGPNPISGNPVVCVGNTTTFGSTTVGGTWTSSNTAVATVGSSSGIITGVAAGTSTISYISGGGCFRTAVVSVGGMPTPIAGTLTMCQGNTTTLTTSPTGGTWSSADAGIADVTAPSGATAVITGVSSGTALISYERGGCTRTTTVIVSAPVASVTGLAAVCLNGTSTLSSVTGGGTWSSSNTAKATVGLSTGLATGVTAGTANITYKTNATCFTTIQFTVNSMPVAITGPGSVCIGYTSALGHVTGGGTWSSSNTAVASVDPSTGVVTGVSAGAMYITYVVAPGGCYAVKSMIVHNVPATITGTPTVCEGGVRLLTSGGGTGTWSSSDTAKATAHPTLGQVTGVSAGTATVTYKITATGCFVTREVTVYTSPAAIGGSTAICNGSVTTYTNAVGGGVWSSTSTSVATIDSFSGTATALTGGGTTIRYTMASGCMATKPITVNAVPAGISGALTVCMGSTIVLSSTTTGATWTSADSSVATITGTTASTCTVSAAGTGTAAISYTNASGCSRIVIVTVNAALAASTGPGVVCVGQAIMLSNITGGGTWSSGAPAKATVTGGTGIVMGVSAGTVNISYSVGGGCSTVSIVTVNGTLAMISGATSVCEGATTTLSHAVGGGTWSSSNTNATVGGTSGVVTGVTAGASTITYWVGTGCYKTMSITIKSLPAPIGGSLKACAGGTTTLADATGGGAWSGGSAGISTVGTASGVVTGIAVGTANVTYTAGNGCYTTAVVTVETTAIAGTIAGSSLLTVGLATTLSPTVSGGTWSSSDNSVATVNGAGVVTGVGAGSVVISYTVANSCGPVSATHTITVYGGISGDLSICVGEPTSLSHAEPGGSWISSDSSVAYNYPSGTDRIFTGVAAGTATVSYLLPGGYLITAVLTVNAVPFSGTITGVSSVDVDATITLSATVSGGTWSSSSTSVATVGSTGVVTGVGAGSVVISYTVTDVCVSVATKILLVTEVNPCYSVSHDTIICSGQGALLKATYSCHNYDTADFAAPIFLGLGIWDVSNDTLVTVYNWTYLDPATAAYGNDTSQRYGYIESTVRKTSATPGNSAGVTMDIKPGEIGGYCLTINEFRPDTIELHNGPNFTYPLIALASAPGVSLLDWNTLRLEVSPDGYVRGYLNDTLKITYSIPGGVPPQGRFGLTATNTLYEFKNTKQYYDRVSFLWSTGDTTAAIIDTPAGSTTYLCTVTAGDMSFVDSTVVTVNPLLFAGVITGASSVVVDATITLTDTVAGGTWSSSDTAIATVGSTGVVTGVNVGSVVISYTVANAFCLDIASHSITVTDGSSRPGAAGGDTKAFSLHPNPTSGSVSIESGVNGKVSLYTIDGRNLQQYDVTNRTTNIQLPRNIPAGIYMLRFKGDDGGTQVMRLVYKP